MRGSRDRLGETALKFANDFFVELLSNCCIRGILALNFARPQRLGYLFMNDKTASDSLKIRVVPLLGEKIYAR